MRRVGARLERELIFGSKTATRDAGVGRDVRDALAQRRRWLIEQELAREEQDRGIYRANMLALLRRRELTRIGAQLSAELHLQYAEPYPGVRIEGIYLRRLDLASGRYALVEKSREFTLVSWQPALERNLGWAVSGIPHGDTISWTLGRQRSGPSV